METPPSNVTTSFPITSVNDYYHRVCSNRNPPRQHESCLPAAPESINRIPTLTSIINLMLYICWCSQTQKTLASTAMNVLFYAFSPGLYSLFMSGAYPTNLLWPFPAEVDDVADFPACQSDNKRETLKSKTCPQPKNKIQHCHHEYRPLKHFPYGSVIGHGIGGTNFLDIMARLAKNARSLGKR
jgi:hypothetical protein